MFETEIIIEIPFHDVDVMNIVWHGHYVKYFEIARCALLEKFDYNYNQMQESNYCWPIIDLRIQFVKPATFAKKIKVAAKIVEYENRLKINYLITDLDSGSRLTKGYTTQVAIDMTTNEMCFISPPVLFKKLGIGETSHD